MTLPDVGISCRGVLLQYVMIILRGSCFQFTHMYRVIFSMQKCSEIPILNCLSESFVMSNPHVLGVPNSCSPDFMPF